MDKHRTAQLDALDRAIDTLNICPICLSPMCRWRSQCQRGLLFVRDALCICTVISLFALIWVALP